MKKIVKQNSDGFIYQGGTRTSDVEETETETGMMMVIMAKLMITVMMLIILKMMVVLKLMMIMVMVVIMVVIVLMV